MVPTLGKKVSDLRAKKGWSQTRLAKEAGCSQQTITKIERNKSIKPRYLPDIAKALGLSVEDLLTNVDRVTAATEDVPRRRAIRVRRERPHWPFENIKFGIYDKLSDEQKVKLENWLFRKITELRARNAAAVQRGKDRAAGRGKKSDMAAA